MGTAKKASGMSAVELLSIGGFSFLMAWTFVGFFWLFRDYPPGLSIGERDMVQLAVFAGIPIGYIVLQILGRFPKFNLFSIPAIAVQLIASLVLPFVAFAVYHGANISIPLLAIANVFAGASAASLMVSWLDILSRLHTESYGRFTSLSLMLGALLFAFAAFMPNDMQPIFGFVYILLSICLLAFATQNAEGNEEAAPLESVESPWKFTKEIEPSFLAFGIVFGLNFVFLFNNGEEALLPGLLSIIPGALLMAVFYSLHHAIGITVVQRILLVVTVCSCIITPFVSLPWQIVCSCVVVAAWAAFRSVHYSLVVQKCAIDRKAPFFRQAPARLVFVGLGFAAGWGIAAVITEILGAHSETFITVRLIMAVVLVVTVMAFYPHETHHLSDGTAEEDHGIKESYSIQMNESEYLEMRCAAIAKLYKLSPRESDILIYLARGRNAAWIQQELVISPHTVKSHIYNIYRKLDIHSQQKLMSFVEEFPLD